MNKEWVTSILFFPSWKLEEEGQPDSGTGEETASNLLCLKIAELADGLAYSQIHMDALLNRRLGDFSFS